ncbi:TIGR03986 family type III CRISPR-associated RAMP protein [Clostridiisalibacter paucivorans]|uniref:TIGR03986 family type III CRISPR-associated RAMP protein n=1 Tax=Clostridiisalibacter paucivorans TaxID=408753 RepID=UPI00047E8187|nr:TIGR03986 family CRISPR-associated RAMP protein [Clostridiisalibacter paucivorans]
MAKIKRNNNNNKIKLKDLHYNFISFPKEWYYPYRIKNSEEFSLPNHNDKNPRVFKNSGYIEYTIKTKGKLTTDFRKNSNNEIFIRGSEIRGRIRNNLEILSFSYPEFIDDKKILYRDFASKNKTIKDEYKETMGIEGSKKINEVVKVGYLQKIGNKYYIYPAEKLYNKNFLTVDEYKLVNRHKSLKLEHNHKMYKWSDTSKLEKIDNLKEEEESLSINIKRLRKSTGLFKNEEFNKKLKKAYCNNKNKWHSKDIEESVKNLKEILGKQVFCDLDNSDEIKLKNLYLERTEKKLKIEKLWKNVKRNIKFKPYEKNVAYSLNENGGIVEIKNPDGNHGGEKLKQGVLYCSNNVNSKKKHYLIGERQFEDKIKVDDKLINAYNDNLKKFKVVMKDKDSQESKEYNKRIKDFYNIFSEENEGSNGKVVFYLPNEEGEKAINIGRTPYMKVLYKNSIKDIINKLNPKDKTSEYNISYAESIFGFTGKGEDKRQAYKSRVRFSNAVVKGKPKFNEEKFFLPQPQASAFAMYLKQDRVRHPKDIKSYAHSIDDIELRGYKFYKIREKEKVFRYSEEYKDMVSIKKVLHPESEIKGKVYFNNLTDTELGMLLISLDISLLDSDNEEYYELFGGAKAYGYGKSIVNINNVYLEQKLKIRALDDLGYKFLKDFSKFIDAYKNKMKKFLEQNKETINEYKLSKKIIKDIENEEHYLDYINKKNKEKKNFAYDQHEVLRPLKNFKDYSDLMVMSKDYLHKTLNKKFKVR